MLWHVCDIVSNCFTSVIFPCRNCDASLSNLWEHNGARARNLCFLYVSKSVLPVPVWKSEYPIYYQGTQLKMTNTLQLSTKSSCFGMVNWLCFSVFCCWDYLLVTFEFCEFNATGNRYPWISSGNPICDRLGLLLKGHVYKANYILFDMVWIRFL